MKTPSFIQVVIAGSILLGALVVYIFWFMTVDAMGKEVASLESEIQARASESDRIAEARNTLSSLAANEARLKSYFINTDEVVVFLERIGATGSQLGADVEVVNVQAETATESRGRMTLALSITGSFDSVMRTVGAIEYGPFDSALSDISLGARQAAEGQPQLWVANATYTIGIQNPGQ